MADSTDKWSRVAALRPARLVAHRAPTIGAPEESDALARLIGAGIGKNQYGEHLSVRNWFHSPEFSEASPVALALLSHGREEALSRRTRSALEDPSRWLFLDTETTGLAGGTGTYAFLVGIAWWDAGGLQVEQFFMRDFNEEHSLLHQLSSHIAQRPVLITFNGKSFDWPLLENRFTMTRAIRVPRLAAHLDLLHPARALWKLRLGSVRLVELERQVLDAPRIGWHREDDVEAALIPQYYFDYLRGGPAEPLAGVVRHNQMDLRGLAALFCKVNELLSAAPNAANEIESLDLFGLSRFLQRRGDPDRAHSACAQALAMGLPAEFRPKARRDLALMAKRRGEHARAAEIWLQIVADLHDGIHACEQLAIYYERHARDLAKAAEFAQLAIAKLLRERANSRDPLLTAQFARLEKKFLQRVARLEKKSRPSSSARPRDARPVAAPKASSGLW